MDAADSGKKVTLVDLDLINPYFAPRNMGACLQKRGIELIAPLYANTNLDLPVISPRLRLCLRSDGTVIFDVGRG